MDGKILANSSFTFDVALLAERKDSLRVNAATHKLSDVSREVRLKNEK